MHRWQDIANKGKDQAEIGVHGNSQSLLESKVYLGTIRQLLLVYPTVVPSAVVKPN